MEKNTGQFCAGVADGWYCEVVGRKDGMKRAGTALEKKLEGLEGIAHNHTALMTCLGKL